MNILIRFIRNCDITNSPVFLIIYLNESMTKVNCNVGDFSKLINVFRNKTEVTCDQKTFEILETATNLPNLKIIRVLQKSIYIFVYNRLKSSNNIDDDKDFFDLIKKYLKINDKKRGPIDLKKRIRSLIIKLIDNPDFLISNEHLFTDYNKSIKRNYSETEKSVFIEKTKCIVSEILQESDEKVKIEKHIELERFYKSEKQVKQHVFKIRSY